MNGTRNTCLLAFGIVATCCHIFNMVVIPLRHETFFTSGGVPDLTGWVVLAGFLLVVTFTVSSLVWILIRSGGTNEFMKREVITLIWGVACLLFLVGEKVMIDEIAREWRMGWERTGEWVILYGFFLVQLGFNLFILTLFRRERRIETPASPQTL